MTHIRLAAAQPVVPDASPWTAEVIKNEPRTTLVLLRRGETELVEKEYRIPAWLVWRTFFRPSRARREHDNLRALARGGVPCADVIGFGETRVSGGVVRSCLVTVYSRSTRPLREILRETDPTSPSSVRTRRALAAGVGRLLLQFHRAGVLWCTASPRNVLVQGDPADASVLAIDVPHALRFRSGLPGTRRALLDLHDAGYSRHQRLLYSDSDRRAMLLAYSAGSRRGARALERVLERRGSIRNRTEKALLKLAWSHILPTFGSGQPPWPRTAERSRDELGQRLRN